MKNTNNLLLKGAAIVALASLISYLFLNSKIAGILLIGFFVLLAMGLRQIENWKRLSFTAWIFAAVCAAMIYPSLFTEIGGYNLKGLIVPLLMIIMFGMGTQMNVQDFWNVVKMPKAVFIGLFCQFTLMPIIGYLLTVVFSFPPEIAAGVILVGCSPSGLASNVMAFIAKANLALSLTLTAVATLLAPIMTPMWMTLLADQLVPIDFVSMMMDIFKIVIAPVILGLLFNHFLSKSFPWLHKIMPSVSMIGIAVIIAIITAAGRDSLLTIGLALVLAAILHNGAGYFLGYSICRFLKMDEASCRTIAFEVGMQNSGLASGIALEMGRIATMGLAPAIFGPWMNISGSCLASWWRDKS